MMNKDYSVFWNSDEQAKLLGWWKLLKEKPSWRAELRRAVSPADVLLCDGFRFLCYELAGYWTTEKNLVPLAAVAGVISHVETYVDESFVKSCAMPSEGKDKPTISELRFSQMQKSRTLDELFIKMIRSVKILRKKANPVSICDSIFHWSKEMLDDEIDPSPRNRFLIRWSLEYFQNIPGTTNKKQGANK